MMRLVLLQSILCAAPLLFLRGAHAQSKHYVASISVTGETKSLCLSDESTSRPENVGLKWARNLAAQCCKTEGTQVSASRPGCLKDITYTQAADLCRAKGLRLCTHEEVANKNMGAGKGCAFDNRHVWTSR